jgi:2-dehydropantoate 2-reductase
VIYGAGAIGGTIGTRLRQAGHEVALIARGRHLDALRRDGLEFQRPAAEEPDGRDGRVLARD